MKTNFTIDLIILLLFLVGFEPTLTGGVVHEWLNLAFAIGILVHLVTHWDWIRASLSRDRAAAPRRLKVNVLLNALSFIVVAMMVLSGLMISRHVLGSGAGVPRESTWRELHETFANVLFLLVGLHFALHWDWIAGVFSRCALRPARAFFNAKTSDEGRMS